MIKHRDWQSRLDTYLMVNEDRPFEYGKWDCCLFVAGAVFSQTGIDIAENFRGRYDSARSALQVIKEFCGSTSILRLMEKTGEIYGLEEISPGFATQGGVSAIKRARGYSLGIISLTGRAIIIVTNRGLWRVSLSMGVKAWRV